MARKREEEAEDMSIDEVPSIQGSPIQDSSVQGSPLLQSHASRKETMNESFDVDAAIELLCG